MPALSVSTLISNNRVTIPESICKYLGLKAGDSVAFKSRDGLNEWSSTPDEHAYHHL